MYKLVMTFVFCVRVLVGTGGACCESLMPLAFSLLVHHVRRDLSLAQVILVAFQDWVLWSGVQLIFFGLVSYCILIIYYFVSFKTKLCCFCFDTGKHVFLLLIWSLDLQGQFARCICLLVISLHFLMVNSSKNYSFLICHFVCLLNTFLNSTKSLHVFTSA